MPILHLWNSRDWRGAEVRFERVIRQLPPMWQGYLAAPPGSPLIERLPPLLTPVPLSCQGWLDLRSILAVRRLVRRRGIRILHAYTSHAHEVALAARIGLPARLVVTRSVSYPISGGWKYRSVDRYIAVSEAARNELQRGGVDPAAIIVVPDPVDWSAHARARPQRLGVDRDRALVACIAAFVTEKNHAMLLRAWQIVERHYPRAHLALVGDGPLRSDIEALRRDLGLARVIVTGWRDDVIDILHGSDIVVLASRDEGLGSILCDAQAAGRPVIGTRAGGIPEALAEGTTGLLVNVGDHAGMASAISELIGDPDRRAQFGHAGRERAARLFDPAVVGAAHRSVYESLIGRPHEPAFGATRR